MKNGLRMQDEATNIVRLVCIDIKDQTSKIKNISAFTVIEVLVSMAIMAIIAVMVSNIFQSGVESWNIGTRKTEVNTSGRAALGFMADELMQAVAGPLESDEPEAADYMPFRVEGSEEIAFLSLSQEPSRSESRRALRGVYFWKEGDVLNYARITQALDCYKNIWAQGRPSGGAANTIIEGVETLRFNVYETAEDLANDDPHSGKVLTNLPFCVDIFLELLSVEDMKTVKKLKDKGQNADEFIDRSSKSYSTRVYFANRMGYR